MSLEETMEHILKLQEKLLALQEEKPLAFLAAQEKFYMRLCLATFSPPTQTEVLQPRGALYLQKQMERGNQQTGLPPCAPRIQLLDSLPPCYFLLQMEPAGKSGFAFPAAPADTINRKVKLCSYQLTRPLALSIAKTCSSTTNHILFATSLPPLAVGEDSGLPQARVSETYLPLEKKKC